MPADIHLQPAYLLHGRPFRDSSLLLDFLTRDHGRMRAIAKGARRAGSRQRGLLQPFVPLQVSLVGRHELKTLRQAELFAPAAPLRGLSLFSALYVNELMTRLIHGFDAEPGLFEVYEEVLARLGAAGADVEAVLRRFEIALLQVLGYGLSFEADAHSGAPIDPGAHYFFQCEEGFIPAPPQVRENDAVPLYSGREIAAIGALDFSDPAVRKAAKRLMRHVLSAHLGDKPLKSRQLFTGH